MIEFPEGATPGTTWLVRHTLGLVPTQQVTILSDPVECALVLKAYEDRYELEDPLGLGIAYSMLKDWKRSGPKRSFTIQAMEQDDKNIGWKIRVCLFFPGNDGPIVSIIQMHPSSAIAAVQAAFRSANEILLPSR